MSKRRRKVWCFCLVVVLTLRAIPYAWSQQTGQTVYVKLSTHSNTSNARTDQSAGAILADINSLAGVIYTKDLSFGVISSEASQRVQSNRKKSKYLDGLTKVELAADTDLEAWLAHVNTYANVIYAEAEQPVELLLTPNDPNLSNQSYLAVIDAFDAWNVTQGDPNIVVAVSDNGTDYGHVDLENKLAKNVLDPENGMDDDNNGYIDDYLGWDLADNDNDPYGDTPGSNLSHGTLVAGAVAAEANNGEGIAGVGYHTSFLPIKIFKTLTGSSKNSYESLIYAADRGCDVINLSWGAAGYKSSTLQDMVNYAVFEKDMVVVAAAGNTNAELDFYPASYDHVLSVGMTDIDDNKAANGTYSYKIDLMAPGSGVYSTAIDDSYKTTGGSSFAAPQVAATAALVRDVFPALNAIQVMEQIRMTADDIYDVGSNAVYEGKLGKGRLNMYRAVSETEVASLRSFDYSFAGPFGQLLFRDDTVVVDISFVNILRPVENVKVNISSTSAYVEILNNEIALGSLSEFDSVKNVSVNIRLKTNTPTNEKIGFRMAYSDVLGYEDFEYFEFTTAPSFLDMDNQNIKFTVGSDGRLGYASDVLDNGVGLTYAGEQKAKFMGIMVGNHADSISDNVINSFLNYTFEDDLVSEASLKFIERNDTDIYGLGTMSDEGADRIHGLLIEQEYLGWIDLSNNDYFISEYRVTNTKGFAKSNMKFGLYMDFNIGDSTTNFVAWDVANKLAYTYSNEVPELLIGIALITDHTAIVHAIDLFDQNELPLDVTSNFTDQLKYNFMNNGKTTAGGASGYDVAQLVTADLGTFPAFGSDKIAYALVFGADLSELIDNVDKAKAKYTTFLSTPPLNLVLGTCNNEDLKLGNSDPLSVYSDALGNNLIASGTDLNLGPFTENSIRYFKEITGGYESDIYKMQISIANPQSDFEASPEILYLGDDPSNEVQFQDLSLGAIQWSWDFKNGSFSSVKNPRTAFHEAGSYLIDFASSTEIGCEESISIVFEVKERGVPPIIEDQTVCYEDAVTIQASNSSALRFFSSKNSEEPFAVGAEFNIASLTESVTYYVSSASTANESIRVPVVLTVDSIKAGFSYNPDTLDFSSASLIRVYDESVNSTDTDWTINNTVVSGGDSFVYDYKNMSKLSIYQEVTSETGCSDNYGISIDLQTTSKGGISSMTICKWDHVEAEPLFGEYFVFYDDEHKTTILNKGRSTSFGPITVDTSFYISNISNYKESELVEFEVNVDEFETQIIANPDSLFFEHDRTALFKLDNKEMATVRWMQSDGQQALAASPSFTYQKAGEYMLTAISANNNSCSDTATLSYRVYQILDASSRFQGLALYPNPATDVLLLSTTLLLDELNLVDAVGKRHRCEWRAHPKGKIMDVSSLPQGVYFLQGREGKHHFNLKFIKR